MQRHQLELVNEAHQRAEMDRKARARNYGNELYQAQVEKEEATAFERRMREQERLEAERKAKDFKDWEKKAREQDKEFRKAMANNYKSDMKQHQMS
jgi:hypothetical protein